MIKLSSVRAVKKPEQAAVISSHVTLSGCLSRTSGSPPSQKFYFVSILAYVFVIAQNSNLCVCIIFATPVVYSTISKINKSRLQGQLPATHFFPTGNRCIFIIRRIIYYLIQLIIRWYWTIPSFDYWRFSIKATPVPVFKRKKSLFGQLGSQSMPCCRLCESGGLSTVRRTFTSPTNIIALPEKPF